MLENEDFGDGAAKTSSIFRNYLALMPLKTLTRTLPIMVGA